MFHLLLLNILISLVANQNNQHIDTYLSDLHQEGKLNGNVLVIKDGKTVYEKSFGYADGSKTALLNKDYRFNIGSVYKEFPAVAIMQLKEQNRINLTDKISKYLTDLPKWSEKVTVKNVMQYSSGLPRIPWNDYFSNGLKVTEESLIEGLKSIDTLNFEPGTDYLYSNNNPILLIKIVEQITQSSFGDYMQENIFDTFDMKGTILKDEFPYLDKTLMAIPFNTEFKEDDYNLAVKSMLFSATARDLAHWFENLGNFKVISKKSVKTLSEVVKVGDHIQAPLGRCDWKNDVITEHAHHGSSANYECIVRRFKQDGITIVILTNQKHRNVHDISDTIYEILTKES